MRSGSANDSRVDSRNNRDLRRNSYPPPSNVTAYGYQRNSSAGPWPKPLPSYFSNTPGGYSPYQRDRERDYQQRHMSSSRSNPCSTPHNNPYSTPRSTPHSNPYSTPRSNPHSNLPSNRPSSMPSSQSFYDARRRSSGVSISSAQLY